MGAIGLLGGRQRLLQRGISLSAAASPAQLLALLDASAQLTGMEHFAGACGARLINGLSDAHPTARADGYTGLGFSSLGLLPGLALHSLSAPAKDLLLRAALTVVADARGRGRLRFTAGQAAAQGQAAPPLLAELDRGDLWLMAATAGRCGSFSWDAGTFDAAELEEGPAALLSPVFRWGCGGWQLGAGAGAGGERQPPAAAPRCSLPPWSRCPPPALTVHSHPAWPPPAHPPTRSIGGHDWRLRLVGLTGELPPDNPWLPVDEDDPEPPAWMLLTLEAANPAALPEQGLEVRRWLAAGGSSAAVLCRAHTRAPELHAHRPCLPHRCTCAPAWLTGAAASTCPGGKTCCGRR